MSDRWTQEELDSIRTRAHERAANFQQFIGDDEWQRSGWRLRKMTTTPVSPAPESTDEPTETEPTPTPTIPMESATKTVSALSSEMRAVGAYRNGEARAMRRQA